MALALPKTVLAAVFVTATVALAPLGVAFAQHGSDDSTTTNTASGATSSDDSSGSRKTEDGTHNELEASDRNDDKGGTTTRAEHRLAEARLKVCQRRHGNIMAIISRSHQRAQNQLDLFATIASRTEAFYAAKGKTLSTYDALVASVDTAKAKADASLAAVPTTFDCNGADPKGDADAFKAALKQEMIDLQAYRKAVKDLITGVKSVQGDA